MKNRLWGCICLLALLVGLCACGASGAPAEPSLRVAVVSDIHYTGRAYRYVGSFRAVNDRSGTGKQLELLPSLLDAFLWQTERERPDALLITGDLSFNGARVSHEELIEKLRPLREAGITVLVLPGNHDVTSGALVFPDGEAEPAPSVSAEEFATLYAEFGYGGALSRDPSSLSYVYDGGNGLRFFMLDTCFRYGTPYGRLGAETMSWLERELRACREAGEIPVAAGHHNALVHNPLFVFGYTMDDGEELRALLMRYGVTLYLSGHLHPQSIACEDGFFDIATESFAVFPHRFGLLEFDGGSWRYTAQKTDAALWAASGGSGDARLLDYDAWGRRFFHDLAYAQAKDSLAASVGDAEAAEQLCEFFAEANVNYFMGTPSAPAEGALEELLSGMEGRTSLYLRLITGIDDSLRAEGRIG